MKTGVEGSTLSFHFMRQKQYYERFKKEEILTHNLKVALDATERGFKLQNDGVIVQPQ